MASDLNGIVLNDLVYSNLENLKQDTKLKDLFYEGDGKTIKTEIASNPQYKELVANLTTYPDFYKSTLDKWEIAGSHKNDDTGHYSLTFYNRENNELFVSNRGTESRKDVITDISMHIGNNIPMQFYDAEDSYLKARDIAKGIEERTGIKPEITVSGHSKGASESDYQFARFYGDGYLSGSFTANEYGTGRLFYQNRIPLYGQEGCYFDANAEHLSEIKRALVNPFDPVSAFSNHWGNMVNPYSENGEYSKSADLNMLFHKLDAWKICEFDEEGNIIYGQINQERAKKFLENLAKERGEQGYTAPEDLSMDSFLSQIDSIIFDANAGAYSSLHPSALAAIQLSSFRELLKKFGEAGNNPYSDPLIVNLKDDKAVTTTSIEDGAFFDLDKNGFAEKTGWLTAGEAFVVRDVNGDGTINNGGELFGDQTVKMDGSVAASGFEALREFDSNQDGARTSNWKSQAA